MAKTFNDDEFAQDPLFSNLRNFAETQPANSTMPVELRESFRIGKKPLVSPKNVRKAGFGLAAFAITLPSLSYAHVLPAPISDAVTKTVHLVVVSPLKIFTNQIANLVSNESSSTDQGGSAPSPEPTPPPVATTPEPSPAPTPAPTVTPAPTPSRTPTPTPRHSEHQKDEENEPSPLPSTEQKSDEKSGGSSETDDESTANKGTLTTNSGTQSGTNLGGNKTENHVGSEGEEKD